MSSSLANTLARSALITRPEPEATEWAQSLRARGVAAETFPLITIGPAPDTERLHAAQARLGHYQAVMFVSGNAARAFFGSNEPVALMQQAQHAINSRANTRFWSPGPGTARMLCALGVPAGLVDTPAADAVQFDSESLWESVGSSVQAGDRVLIVRGSDAARHDDLHAAKTASTGTGREWLSAQIKGAGAEVDYVVAYTRAAPLFDAEALARVRAAVANGAPWVLSSAQALGHLLAAFPAERWHQARVLATHPRIADAARAAGFGAVTECRPALSDVAQALASIESAA